MSFLKPDTPPPSTLTGPQDAVAATPPPVLAPQGSKPGKKSQTSTFLGAADVANPSGGTSGKTLLGA